MKVAVPLLQHSQWLGHLALSQTVCSFSSSSSARVFPNEEDVGNFSRSHSGSRGRKLGLTVSVIIQISSRTLPVVKCRSQLEFHRRRQLLARGSDRIDRAFPCERRR